MFCVSELLKYLCVKKDKGGRTDEQGREELPEGFDQQT